MNRYSKLIASIFAISAIFTAGTNASAQTMEHAGHSMNASDQILVDTPLSIGEIKKVDRDTGKLTIKHGPLTNLDMPGMTMAFKVQDASMLEQVKTGDSIRFRVEKLNGSFTVTKLEAAK